MQCASLVRTLPVISTGDTQVSQHLLSFNMTILHVHYFWKNIKLNSALAHFAAWARPQILATCSIHRACRQKLLKGNSKCTTQWNITSYGIGTQQYMTRPLQPCAASQQLQIQSQNVSIEHRSARTLYFWLHFFGIGQDMGLLLMFDQINT